MNNQAFYVKDNVSGRREKEKSRKQKGMFL